MSDPKSWCPGCHPGEVPDPLTEYLDRCFDHPVQPLTGTDDNLVVPNTQWSPYTTDEAVSAQNRAACALIHRGEPRTEDAP